MTGLSPALALVLAAATVRAAPPTVLRQSSGEVEAPRAGKFRLEYRLEERDDGALSKVLRFHRAGEREIDAFGASLGTKNDGSRYCNYSYKPRGQRTKSFGVMVRKPPLEDDEEALIERLATAPKIAEHYFREDPGELRGFFERALELIKRSPVAEKKIGRR